MNLFGKTNPDLHLLRHNEARLQELVQDGGQYQLLEEQLAHHCIRTAWMESRHNNMAVRQVLAEVTAHAYAVLYTCAPLDMEPFEPLGAGDIVIGVDNVLRIHDMDVCLGFLLDAEAATLHGVATGDDPENLHGGIFEGNIFWLHHVEVPPVYACADFSADNLPPLTYEQQSYAKLLVLKRWWSRCSARISTDVLSRETVRRVTQVAGKARAQPDLELLNWRIGDARERLIEFKQLIPRLGTS